MTNLEKLQTQLTKQIQAEKKTREVCEKAKAAYDKVANELKIIGLTIKALNGEILMEVTDLSDGDGTITNDKLLALKEEHRLSLSSLNKKAAVKASGAESPTAPKAATKSKAPPPTEQTTITTPPPQAKSPSP